MEELIITQMDKEVDLPQITAWDSEFQGNSSYNSIRHFILEDDIYRNISEVIKLNYEEVPIGDNERHYALMIKNPNTKKVAGFIIASEYDIDTDNPELFLQYIVLNPNYQGKGHGKKLLKRLASNADGVLEKKPTYIYSYIERENIASQNIYLYNGYALKKQKQSDGTNSNYLKADKYILTKEDTLE